MAKASNPAEAHRKAQKEKDKKRNKEARDNARKEKAVKSGVGQLGSEISALADKETSGTITKAEKSQLSKLRSEFQRIKTVRAEKAAEEQPKASTSGSADVDQSKYFTKDGKVKNPKRSVYYDPVFNPYGVPPPGMPYKERSPSPETLDLEGVEVDNAPDDADGPKSEEDIPMPDAMDSGEDSDGIVMPDEPMPGADGKIRKPKQYYLPRPILRGPQPPPPLGPPPSEPPKYMPLATEPPRPILAEPSSVPPPPNVPPPPPGFPSDVSLPEGFAPPTATAPVVSAPPRTAHPLPAKPVPPPAPPVQTVISGEAQIRDLKAEATAFIPAALKRKRGPAAKGTPADSASGGAVNAAPQADSDGDADAEQRAKRPNLIGELTKAGIGRSA